MFIIIKAVIGVAMLAQACRRLKLERNGVGLATICHALASATGIQHLQNDAQIAEEEANEDADCRDRKHHISLVVCPWI